MKLSASEEFGQGMMEMHAANALDNAGSPTPGDKNRRVFANRVKNSCGLHLCASDGSARISVPPQRTSNRLLLSTRFELAIYRLTSADVIHP
jgi:hypothetical protein